MKVFILRGVPGSGKSTLARELISEGGVIHCTDDFFLVDGQYVFDPKQLRVHHQMNYEAFLESLRMKVPTIVVDNTNTRKFEYAHYLEAALKAGYEVEVICLPHPDPMAAFSRNTHGVPLLTIKRMIERFED